MSEIVERLRRKDNWTQQKPYWHERNPDGPEAADLIEQQAREITRLDTMLTGYQLAMQEQLEIRQRNEAKIEELNIALTNVGAVVAELTSDGDGDDAARYRWLRDHSCPPHNFYISVPDEFHGVRYAPGDVDAYIDAARAALEKSNVE